MPSGFAGLIIWSNTWHVSAFNIQVDGWNRGCEVENQPLTSSTWKSPWNMGMASLLQQVHLLLLLLGLHLLHLPISIGVRLQTTTLSGELFPPMKMDSRPFLLPSLKQEILPKGSNSQFIALTILSAGDYQVSINFDNNNFPMAANILRNTGVAPWSIFCHFYEQYWAKRSPLKTL